MRTSLRRLLFAIAGVAAVVLQTRGNLTPLQAQAPGRERTMFVSALDSKGEPVAGLGPEAFVIREDGARREVLHVSKATEPMDVAILVDNSAAMADDLLYLREAVSGFAARMGPANPVALIGLADRPTILVDYTRDAMRLSEGAGRLFAMSGSGMTLLDAVVETSKGLVRRNASRAVIVPVVTDGVEFTNRYSGDVTKALVQGRIALHAVTVGKFDYSDDHAVRERSFFLEAGPRESGGQRSFLVSAHGLAPALQRLARELSSQYKVVYARPESLIPPEKSTVSPGRPGLTMRGTPARGE